MSLLLTIRRNNKCRTVSLIVGACGILLLLYVLQFKREPMRNKLAFYETPPLTILPTQKVADAEEFFHKRSAMLEVNCPKAARFGQAVDGGWNVCLYGAYNFSQPCLVYSFGINNDWSFDDHVAKNFSCTVRAFDPSMAVGDHKRGENIYFYKRGISGKKETRTNGWQMNTFQGFISELNDTGKMVEYLKIDVEYSEWYALDSIFNASALSKVKQLGIEIHTKELNRHIYPNITTPLDDYISYSNLFQRLQDAGFYRWYWHFNHYGKYTSRHSHKVLSCCYEMVFINVNIPS